MFSMGTGGGGYIPSVHFVAGSRYLDRVKSSSSTEQSFLMCFSNLMKFSSSKLRLHIVLYIDENRLVVSLKPIYTLLFCCCFFSLFEVRGHYYNGPGSNSGRIVVVVVVTKFTIENKLFQR